MQETAEKGVTYKVLFLGMSTLLLPVLLQWPDRNTGRHGQGWHNFAVDQYGAEVSPPPSSRPPTAWF